MILLTSLAAFSVTVIGMIILLFLTSKVLDISNSVLQFMHRFERTQVSHVADHLAHGVINLLLGGEATKSEAAAAVGEFVRDAAGPKHVAGLNAGQVQAEPEL